MSRCRFVQPDIVRLPLSDGDFIDVKRELNAGEQRKLFAGMVRDGVIPGEKTVLDPEQVGITKLVAYLVGWSLVDAKGAPVPVSEAALKNLDVETYTEIMTAVDTHETEQEAKRALAKNPESATGSKATSESVAKWDGDTSGSDNSQLTSTTS